MKYLSKNSPEKLSNLQSKWLKLALPDCVWNDT